MKRWMKVNNRKKGNKEEKRKEVLRKDRKIRGLDWRVKSIRRKRLF